ncbi:uncharacterized protein LOC142329025 isoform X3 [Lycorma delicatula]|uniref:uncharacterized protein LOC142329025 isoform X3 n=1 Tax=Lycorma delicatula TaxID=130591 RepID=UPI003F5174D8
MLGKGKLKETNIWFMNTKEKFVDDAFKYENIAKIGQGSYSDMFKTTEKKILKKLLLLK